MTVGIRTPERGCTMSFRLFIYYCAVLGGCAAFVGWGLGRLADIETFDDLLDGGLGILQPVEDHGLDELGPGEFALAPNPARPLFTCARPTTLLRGESLLR